MSEKFSEEDKKSKNKNIANDNKEININYIEQKENEKKFKNNNEKKGKNRELTNLQNPKQQVKSRQNDIILKNLKQKENTLINEINSLKSIKNEMGTLSYNNISQAKIDNTLHDNKIKKLNKLENNLIDKLMEIKRQINDITKNNNNPKFEKKNNTNNNNNYIISIDKVQLLEQNDFRLMEIQKEYKNKQKELREFEEKNKNLKLKYLQEQRQKEIELIRKRKKDIDDKMKIIKEKIQPTPKENEYLFHKMEKNFQDNEKKLLHKITTERKAKNIYYPPNVDIKNIENEFQNYKSQLEQRAKEQTYNMKQLWHSRSMIMKQYQTNMMKTIKEKDENEAKNEKLMKLTKKGLFLEKEIYGKNKVRLPPIDEKLKQESIFNQIDIKTLKGEERIQYVKNKYMQPSLIVRNKNKEFDYGKRIKNIKKTSNSININQIPSKKMDISISYDNIINKNNSKNKDIKNKNIACGVNSNNIINKNNNIKINKLVSSADKIKIKKNPKEINYLEEFKNKKKENYHKWNKYIVNKDSKKLDLEGLQNINKQIESLDEKVNMGNELIKIKGGYENNIDFGNKVSNMLIDSINGKLAVIKELYNDKKN